MAAAEAALLGLISTRQHEVRRRDPATHTVHAHRTRTPYTHTTHAHRTRAYSCGADHPPNPSLPPHTGSACSGASEHRPLRRGMARAVRHPLRLDGRLHTEPEAELEAAAGLLPPPSFQPTRHPPACTDTWPGMGLNTPKPEPQPYPEPIPYAGSHSGADDISAAADEVQVQGQAPAEARASGDPDPARLPPRLRPLPRQGLAGRLAAAPPRRPAAPPLLRPTLFLISFNLPASLSPIRWPQLPRRTAPTPSTYGPRRPRPPRRHSPTRQPRRARRPRPSLVLAISRLRAPRSLQRPR